MNSPSPLASAAGLLLATAWPAGSVRAAPAGINLGFEDGLAGWSHAQVAILVANPDIADDKVHSGLRSLALKNGHVEQTFTGLLPGGLHTVMLAYRDDTPQSWILSHARIRIDGKAIGKIHNGQSHEYLESAGFEFVATGPAATLRIESLMTGSTGFLIDDVRILPGGLPAAPEHAWNTLAAVHDPRGGRRLANGSFEAATSDPDTDPDNSGPAGNPHLRGLSLPGWRVTRENVDLIGFSTAKPPHGSKAVDLGGHGPGGIAQTVTGLPPGSVHTFSFRYARHVSWGSGDMTGEVLANGRPAATLVRTLSQTWDNGYGLIEIPLLATAEGKLGIELRSTVTDQGGGIVLDDLRLKSGGDGFLAWSQAHGIAPDPAADDDGDSLANGLEFLFGTDPRSRTMLPAADSRRLRIPLSGLALARGFNHRLLVSRTLDSWQVAGTGGNGLSLASDSSGPGIDGERVYVIDPAEPRFFWKHEFTSPPLAGSPAGP